LETITSWLSEHYKWIFSGVGVTVIVGIFTLFFTKKQASSSQIIRSGKGSTNIQSGRDVIIGTQTKKNDVDEG